MSAFDDAWADFETEAGPVLKDELSIEAPVGGIDDPYAGTLAASMEWRDNNGVLTAGSTDFRGPIAAYVARGTRPHDIYPVWAPALHFFARDGTEVYTQHVSHPGTTANQFHIRAWENSREEVQQMFFETVGRGVTLSYLNPWRNQVLGED